jgi:hypothetical protein
MTRGGHDRDDEKERREEQPARRQGKSSHEARLPGKSSRVGDDFVSEA